MSPKVGLTIMEMMQGCIDGKIKGMVILGENPVVSDPDSNHVKHALESAEFFMAIDIFPTPTTQLAHLVLPAASFAEVDGTFTNSERRVQTGAKGDRAPGRKDQLADHSGAFDTARLPHALRIRAKKSLTKWRP